MKTLRTAFLALFLVGLFASPGIEAQSSWDLGPYLGLNFENDKLLIGGVARIHLASSPITLNPAIEFYPGINDTGAGLSRSLLVLNFDGQYQIEAESWEPYVGAGISWARAATDTQDAVTDIGLNIKGGMLFNPRGSAQPYTEAVINFDGGTNPFMLKAGLLFAL
jgi:hypothetical protein